MSAFPDLPHDQASTRQPSDGTVVDYGDDGSARVRVMFATTQMTFNLVLKQMASAASASLAAHYAANKWAPFSYTWPLDSSTYTCVYLEPPALNPSAAHDCQDATVKLAGTAA